MLFSTAFRTFACLVFLGTTAVARLAADPSSPVIPNARFNQGDQSPTGWTLSGPQGRWVDRETLEVTGNGTDNGKWTCESRLEPRCLYRLQARVRAERLGNGCVVMGTPFANGDCAANEEWRWYSRVFWTPDDAAVTQLHLGHWCAGGVVQFDAIRLTPLRPVYENVGPLELGEGESIHAGCYRFVGRFSQENGNFHRTLASSTAGFNSNRWCFGSKTQVTYRFGLPNHPFRSGTIAFNVSYHERGSCVAEISRDQVTWQTLVTRDGLGRTSAVVPAELFPAETLYFRLRCASDDDVFQVDLVEWTADVGKDAPEGSGRTRFVAIDDNATDLAVERIAIDDSEGLGRPTVRLGVRNASGADQSVELLTKAVPLRPDRDDEDPVFDGTNRTQAIASGQTGEFAVAMPLSQCGDYALHAVVRMSGGQHIHVTVPWTLPEFYRTDYGARIEGVEGAAAIWSCEAAWKVPRQRAVPELAAAAATLSAARNDREAVQIVIRPTKDLKQLTAAVGTFTGPNGATLPAQNIRLLREHYHFTATPTDATSARDWWPDALPPLDAPLDLPAAQNQPLWLLIHVPHDAVPGDYAGSVTLKADGWAATVPVKLHVWRFALPERNHVETAFGLYAPNVFRYHRLKNDAEKRQVVDMYLQSFAEHRISPYNPAPLDPIGVEFVPKADPPVARLDFKAFDEAVAQAIKKYHFTNFVLPLQGMPARIDEWKVAPGNLAGFGDDTPQYEALFASYVKQLEDHLREKGWLRMAYTYWFDEPNPPEYPYVQSGMDRLKKYAPDIQTMITKHELQETWNGKVDIWCPISPCYKQDTADKRRAEGSRYWWYVCCGPKAPCCGLFLDHPSVELRTWLWQTWQRDIAGVLIWETVYWTPLDTWLQNPYTDPMSYVGGCRPEDANYWGNGDGRFLYPPEAVFAAGGGDAPVLSPPVSSIRLEMLREGIEDSEFLWQLRDLIEERRATLSAEELKTCEALLQVPDSITSNLTTFSKDPRPIYARRQQVAEAIERLEGER